MKNNDKTIMLQEFHPQIEKEAVFRMLECREDSSVYEEMSREFEELLPFAETLLDIRGVMTHGTIPAAFLKNSDADELCAVIFVLVTVGEEISRQSTEAFARGEYVRGMLLDAMADAALFSLERDIQKELRLFCAREKCGIQKRLEAPQDLPMEVQKQAFEQTNAQELLGLGLSEGCMFQPIKTSCQIYLTSEDVTVFRARHNCRTCKNKTCMFRQVQPVSVTVLWKEKEETFLQTGEENLLEFLQKQCPGISAPCGGRGACGKCKVQTVKGKLPVTAEDTARFSDAELNEGWRLACRAYVQEDVTIRVSWEKETEIRAVGTIPEANMCKLDGSEAYGFAVDIGTTTLAVSLVLLSDGKCIDTCTALNSQRAFGADVIARILNACEGKAQEMRKSVLSDLAALMKKLQQKHSLAVQSCQKIVIAGNTTMLHLLLGYPCNGLGTAPFRAYSLKPVAMQAAELFEKSDLTASVWIFPGISAFVGADITAGMQALKMGESEEISLLVDLGTNGELVLGNNMRLIAASTAAGPAFEGGNITYGVGSIPGAVCRAKWQKTGCGGNMLVETIGKKVPIGICGTGVVELTAELLNSGIVDETGLLTDEWFYGGYPVAQSDQKGTILLTQKDIREIQLAKAAIRSGIEALLVEYGITADEVAHIYVAGGFGYWLDYKKAIAIGMLPKCFEGRIRPAGNTALLGAQQVLLEPDKIEKAMELARRTEEISLSDNRIFQEAYVDSMLFEIC